MFDQITNEKLGFYVYALIDTRNEQPFYNRKGKNSPLNFSIFIIFLKIC